MSALAGQALLRLCRRLLGFAFALCLLAGAALGALAWRLDQGPLDLPWLAEQIEREVNAGRPGGPTRLEVGRATIAWEGWRGGHLTPVDVRLSAVRVVEGEGPGAAVRAELPDASVSLSLPWLLRGRLAPRVVELDRPALRLLRAEDGTIRLDLGSLGPEGDEEQQPAASATLPPAGPDAGAAPASPLDAFLVGLLRPVSDDAPLSALSSVVIRGGRVLVLDRALGTVWSLDRPQISLLRLEGGGVVGQGTALLRLGAERVPLRLRGRVTGGSGPMQTNLQLELPRLRPAALAREVRAFAPLAALDAPASLTAWLRLNGGDATTTWGGTLMVGAGRVDLGEGRIVAIAGLEAELTAGPGTLRLERSELRLAPPPSAQGPGPVLAVQGEARREAGDGWNALVDVALDQLSFADLPAYWPEGLGSGERRWILENVTAGVVRDGRWRLALRLPADLAAGAALTITSLSGQAEATGATVHWLRPIPPGEDISATANFGLDAITIGVLGGRQSGTALELREGGTIRFAFPEEGPPTADIQLQVAGPVADTLDLLRHPRLRLFERRPMPVQGATGTVSEAKLSVAFPLLDDLPVEELRVQGTARLAQVRIPDLLFGQALERAALELSVNNDGLRATGNGQLAEIPARLGVELDFRSGPATQVVSRESVQARADARRLAALLDLPLLDDVAQGPVVVEANSERQRNGEGRVGLRADLRDAALRIEPLAWSKPPGARAALEAVLRLQGEELRAMEPFRLQAPELSLRGSLAFAPGARLERATISEGVVQASRFQAELRAPARDGGEWGVTLRGAALDLRAALAAKAAAESVPGAAPAPAARATRYAVDARMERVLLGEGRGLTDLAGQARIDTRGTIASASIGARTGERGDIRLDVTPREGGVRDLHLAAEDAGALLRAFDVVHHIQGGRLVVTGQWQDWRPGATLSGTAEMADFSVRDAPAIAKLLQAMTLYGLVEAARGPGLGFSRMVAPFALSPDALELRDARAFSASLGLTARGRIDRRRQAVDMEGTIVPAYVFNSLLGHIPLIGRLFSPETGGGVFAATWRMQGPLSDPQVSVNPLAALTPGFLRGLFGIGEQGQQPAAPPQPQQ